MSRMTKTPSSRNAPLDRLALVHGAGLGRKLGSHAFVLAMLAACSSSGASVPDGSMPTCEQTIQRWSEELSNLERDLDRSCTSDDECVALSTNLACDEGAFVGGCPTAIVEARRAEAEAALSEARSRGCAEADPSCRSAPLCLLVDAACVDGVCTMR